MCSERVNNLNALIEVQQQQIDLYKTQASDMENRDKLREEIAILDEQKIKVLESEVVLYKKQEEILNGIISELRS